MQIIAYLEHVNPLNCLFGCKACIFSNYKQFQKKYVVYIICFEFFLLNYLVSAGYSDVSLQYGTFGRVYIRHYQYGYNTYEVCSNGFSSTDGEAICRSRGLLYSSYSTYVIYNHSIFEIDLKCLILMYCNLMVILFPELHQATISPQWPPIAIHTAFTIVTSEHKATVHRHYTSIALVRISALYSTK